MSDDANYCTHGWHIENPDPCPGCAHTDASLIAELAAAENANQHARPCQVCDALEAMSEAVKPGVRKALAGTIGEKKLAAILTRNGYTTGARAVRRHRMEGHS